MVCWGAKGYRDQTVWCVGVLKVTETKLYGVLGCLRLKRAQTVWCVWVLKVTESPNCMVCWGAKGYRMPKLYGALRCVSAHPSGSASHRSPRGSHTHTRPIWAGKSRHWHRADPRRGVRHSPNLPPRPSLRSAGCCGRSAEPSRKVEDEGITLHYNY